MSSRLVPTTMTCRICGAKFETIATSGKYCPGCRKKAHREKSKQWAERNKTKANPPYAKVDTPEQMDICLSCDKPSCSGWCAKMMEESQ